MEDPACADIKAYAAQDAMAFCGHEKKRKGLRQAPFNCGVEQ